MIDLDTQVATYTAGIDACFKLGDPKTPEELLAAINRLEPQDLAVLVFHYAVLVVRDLTDLEDGHEGFAELLAAIETDITFKITSS